jgi:hypothetical protein
VTDAERDQNRRELIDEITRAVRVEFRTLVADSRKALREELRHELLVSGLVRAPYHIQDGQECIELAMRLRDTANLLDPPGEATDWLADPAEEKREGA